MKLKRTLAVAGMVIGLFAGGMAPAWAEFEGGTGPYKTTTGFGVLRALQVGQADKGRQLPPGIVDNPNLLVGFGVITAEAQSCPTSDFSAQAFCGQR